MRNLKRALSLTLASVMLLGMMVVGTSAASFPDVTENDNVEAIEVLAAVKVLQGRDDGSFDPTATVTRNEMATIICRMMGWRDGDFAGLNPFPDVPAWASNYVAACVANGIINGRDDGRFHGDDTVTATEAASMMLRALGYTRMPVGAAWAQAVAQQASKINLFDGLDVGAYTAMNRGDVAQLALNTLESPMVEVEDNTLDINAGNGVSISGGQINYVVIASNKDYAKAISRVETEGHGLNGVSGPIVELGEQVFNGDLKKVNNPDNFGRPSAIWSYKSTEIGKYPDGAEQTWTGKVSEKALYDAVGTAAYDNYRWTVYQNGAIRVTDSRVGTSNGVAVYGNEAREAAIANGKTSSERVLSSGNGVVTQVYVDSDAKTVVLTMIDTGLAEVTRCTEVDGKYETTVSFKTRVADPNNGSPRTYSPDTKFVSEQKFERGDMVIYTASVDSGSIESMAVAQTVTGTVTTVKNADYVIIDGKTYNYNFAYTKEVAKYGISNVGLYSLDDNIHTNPAVSKEATLYLDASGCPIAFEGKAATAEDYLFVKEVGEVFKSEPSAKVVFFDGTTATITVSKVDSKDATAYAGSGNWKATDVVPNAVYKYSKGSDGYSLEPVTQYYNNTLDSVKITKDSPSISLDKEWNGKADTTSSTARNNATANSAIVTDNNTVFVDAKNNKAYTGYRGITTKDHANVVAVNDTNGRACIVFFYGSNLTTTPDNDDFIILKGTGYDNTEINGKKVSRYTDAWDANGNKLDNAYVLTSVAENTAKSGKGVYLVIDRDGDNNISDVTSKLFALPGNAGVTAGGAAAASNYALKASNGVITMNDNINLTPNAAATNKSVFAYDKDTKFLVVRLDKNGDPTGDITVQDSGWITAWDVNKKSECTGVYVLTVDDVNTSTIPTAESVLVVVPDSTTTSTGGGGGGGGDATMPEGIVSVDVTTDKADVKITFDTSKFTGKPGDDVVANAIIAELAKAENGSWTVDKTKVVIDGSKIEIPATKQAGDFTSSDKFTFKKVDASYLVAYKVGGTAKTAAWNTKVGDATNGANAGDDGKAYVKVVGTAPAADTYVLNNTTVKTGANYEATNKYYKVSAAANANAGNNDGIAFSYAALSETYKKSTDTVDIIVTGTGNASTGGQSATIAFTGSTGTTPTTSSTITTPTSGTGFSSTITLTVALGTPSAADIAIVVVIS